MKPAPGIDHESPNHRHGPGLRPLRRPPRFRRTGMSVNHPRVGAGRETGGGGSVLFDGGDNGRRRRGSPRGGPDHPALSGPAGAQLRRSRGRSHLEPEAHREGSVDNRGRGRAAPTRLHHVDRAAGKADRTRDQWVREVQAEVEEERDSQPAHPHTRVSLSPVVAKVHDGRPAVGFPPACRLERRIPAASDRFRAAAPRRAVRAGGPRPSPLSPLQARPRRRGGGPGPGRGP
jgi:hypothetical protein